MKKLNDRQLREDLLSIRNSVDIAVLIIDSNRRELLATAIEEIYSKSQTILDEHCVIRYEPSMKIEHIDKE